MVLGFPCVVGEHDRQLQRRLGWSAFWLHAGVAGLLVGYSVAVAARIYS